MGPLTTAQSCGTKVIFRLTKTEDMLNDNGVGLSLSKLEASWQPLVGKIEPYIGGTIVGHLVIDEPHDCQDWGGACHQLVRSTRLRRFRKNIGLTCLLG